MKRAETYEEICPLIEYCKEGRVFDAQAWVAAGKPLDPPHWPPKKARKHSPLQYAIDSGCHSMVQLLLEGGAEVEQNERYCALQHAVWDRRFDLLKLLVDHGGDVRKPSILEVFSSWDADIIGLFIDLGADVMTDNPLADALCNRNRVALNVFMRYRDMVPDFQRQLNMALEHHCRKGDKKWVSLMLWAGADPYDYASSDPGRPGTEEEDGCAITSAIFSGSLEIFGIRKLLSNPLHPNAVKCFRYACAAKDAGFADLMLKSRHQVNDRADGTSSLIAAIYSHLPWELRYEYCSPAEYPGRSKWCVDQSAVTKKAKILELILERGAKWRPVNSDEVNAMRKAMAKMDESATFDFVRLMEKYKACERAPAEELFQKGFLRLRVCDYYVRIMKLVARLPVKM